MKITTTIEKFDKNAFDIGAIYFVQLEIDTAGAECTGLFICTEISKSEDSATLQLIKLFGAKAWNLCVPVIITPNNYDIITEIYRVHLSCSYFRDADNIPHFKADIDIAE